VGGQGLSAAEPDDQAVDKGNEPEKHVDEVDPYGVLHADLTALLWSRVSFDVDVSEESEKGCPEDARRQKISKSSRDD